VPAVANTAEISVETVEKYPPEINFSCNKY
jgi:hypothetical protein